jgi:peptidoglycan/xylan/chitin deacetylase (PgdA/CDA1 family)
VSVLPGLGVPVLMYHWVNPDPGKRLRLYGVTPEAFHRQVRWMKNAGYEAVSLADLLAHVAGSRRLPARSIVITFDDGYRDNVEHAGPILEAAGWPATIFLVTDRAGDVNRWDLAHGDPPRALLDWEEARGLDGGVFSFEPHSRTHPDLTQVAPLTAREEIAGAGKRLADELGRPATVFSYPHGAFNEGLEEMVQEAGYLGAVTDLQGLNRTGGDPYRIRRTMITSREFLAAFAFKFLTGYGVYGLKDETLRRLAGRPARWEETGAGARQEGGGAE